VSPWQFSGKKQRDSEPPLLLLESIPFTSDQPKA